jgi:hypothetical protein
MNVVQMYGVFAALDRKDAEQVFGRRDVRHHGFASRVLS